MRGLLEEARRQVDIDQEALDQQLEDVRTSTSDEISRLDQAEGECLAYAGKRKSQSFSNNNRRPDSTMLKALPECNNLLRAQSKREDEDNRKLAGDETGDSTETGAGHCGSRPDQCAPDKADEKAVEETTRPGARSQTPPQQYFRQNRENLPAGVFPGQTMS